MKMYLFLLSLGAGVLVGVIYGLLNVRSPAPPCRTAADYMAQALAQAGVKRIYGVVGDSLNGFNDSLRRLKSIEWIHVRHEEGAAFAAGAEAHLTGKLTVCAGSCGPGNTHLINGLYDAHRNRVPVESDRSAQLPSSRRRSRTDPQVGKHTEFFAPTPAQGQEDRNLIPRYCKLELC